MFILLEPDVNGGGSSNPDPAPATEGVTEVTSPVTETPASTKPEKGLAEVLKETFDKHLEAATKEEPVAETVEETGKETVEEVKEEVKEEKVDEKAEPKVEEGKPVPYTRFQEVITQKNAAEAKAKQFEKAAQAQESVRNFCQEHNISHPDFQFWMNVAAFANTDPEQALALLAPRVNSLQSFTGTVLSPELEAAVEAGEITKEWAMKVAKAQGTSKLTQAQQRQMQERSDAQQEATLAKEFASAVGSWEKSTKDLDPDFKPKSSPNAKDGKYEIWLAAFEQGAKRIEDLSAQALVEAAKRAYATISDYTTSLVPKTTNGKILRTSQTTTTPVAKPKTVREAIANRARTAHGIEMPPL